MENGGTETLPGKSFWGPGPNEVSAPTDLQTCLLTGCMIKLWSERCCTSWIRKDCEHRPKKILQSESSVPNLLRGVWNKSPKKSGQCRSHWLPLKPLLSGSRQGAGPPPICNPPSCWSSDQYLVLLTFLFKGWDVMREERKTHWRKWGQSGMQGTRRRLGRGKRTETEGAKGEGRAGKGW